MLADLNKNIIEAKKKGDKVSVGVLNLVKSELQSNEKSKKPKPEVDVVKSYMKKLQKSLPLFEGSESYEKLENEVKLVKTLLPKELSEEEIQATVDQYVTDHPDEKHIGKVIGALKVQMPDADGSVLAKIVKATLTSS